MRAISRPEDKRVRSAELCHMVGEIRANYGLPLELGGSIKGKWAYMFENLNTAHALGFKYDVYCTDKATIFEGCFEDDPILYGNNVMRPDTMAWSFVWERVQREVQVRVEGTGKSKFYGNYVVCGTLFIDASGRRAHIRFAKIKPGETTDKLLTDNRIRQNQDDWLDDGEEASDNMPKCEADCCCRTRRESKQDDDNDEDMEAEEEEQEY